MMVRPVARPAEDRIERLLARLLAAPSTQTEHFEGDPAVQAFVRDVAAAEAERLGLDFAIDDFGNLVSAIGRDDGPICVLFTYAMTHPVNQMTDPFVPRVLRDKGGVRRIRGRGAAEQKGGLAAAMLAAAALKEREHELKGQLLLCLSPSGETGRHDSARIFMNSGVDCSRVRSCIIAIATNNSICVANKGRLDIDILVHGRAAHSSVPWQGRNAIEGASVVLDRLARLELAGEHPRLGRPTLTPTAIRSWPEATHTVQDRVQLVFDRRLLPGDDPEAALEQLRSACAELDGWTVEVEPGPLMYPSEVSPDSEIVEALREAFEETDSPDPVLTYSHGCIDAGFFNAAGVPTVMVGPGEPSMWHTDEESVALTDVGVSSAVYATALLRQLTEANGRRTE